MVCITAARHEQGRIGELMATRDGEHRAGFACCVLFETLRQIDQGMFPKSVDSSD